MKIINTADHYGLITVLVHWICALGVIALFALGIWMGELGYYDKWYRSAPHLHKSFGVVLVFLFFLRLVWRLYNPKTLALQSHKPWEKISSKITHALFYLLLFSMFASGYFITTAKGQALEVFSLLSIPSVFSGLDNLEDLAGTIHKVIAFSIIGLAVLHAIAALKHHFVDKDKTLLRMLGKNKI